MSVILPEKDLPVALTDRQAVEAAYGADLTEAAGKLRRGLPVLIEADKDLSPWLFTNVRDRLKPDGFECVYLDGRNPPEGTGGMVTGFVGIMLAQLRAAVRGAVQHEKRVLVIPHLDLLTTSQGGLTSEAREVIPLLYENPQVVWLGFKDPSFPLPQVIDNLFPHRVSLMGIPRPRIRHLVTQKESRKFGRQFNPWQLYKYVSGVNAVRLRKLLSTLEGEDYPSDPKNVIRQLRQATLTGTLEVPELEFDRDIGGYAQVKKRLRQEILDVMALKDKSSDPDEVTRLEELIPRGMIFWGPPGTGKTFFAKAVAAALGAAVTVVSGPELKSKWVGESLPWDEEVFVVLNGRARRLPIGELVDRHADDDVRTWTVRDDGTATLAPVTGFIRHKGPDYIDVLVTETGREVRVTGGHSVFVREGDRLGEVFAEQVVPGETRIAVPLRLEAPEEVRELNLLDLLAGRDDVSVAGYDELLAEAVGRLGVMRARGCVGVSVKRLRHARRPPLSVPAFRRLAAEAGITPDPRGLSLYCHHPSRAVPAVLPLTPDLGEFLGRWAADGCFHRHGPRVSVHRDEVEQVAALCGRLFGHVTRYEKPASPNGIDLYVNSAILRRLMEDGLGLGDGSERKRVPAVIFLAPLPVVAAFLRGYFSGDGTFTKKYIEATTVSRGLANDIITLLQYFGIAARCRVKVERRGRPAYRVRFGWSEFLRRFADHIGFADERRDRAVRDYLANLKLRRDVQTPARHITNDVLWDRVVEKRRETYAREHVYDLSVPETERFVAGFGNVLVHNSESNLRQLFHKARQSAPSIIVFDELDSIASARGTYTGSGVEHSMVNQLLTEMDGFHREEMVFVVGTTNFVEALDPALLRPGRFEFHLHIPYPKDEDRRAILEIYDRKMRLNFAPEAYDFAVKRTDSDRFRTAQGTPFSGDHLNALCRAVARIRLRENVTGPTTPELIERGLTEYEERLDLSPEDEFEFATHEAGHFICMLHCPHTPPPERITIRSEVPWAGAYVRQAKDESRKYGLKKQQMLDDMVVMCGGIEAERLLLGDVSTGASGGMYSDLDRLTLIARTMVEYCGMGEATGLRVYRDEKGERDVLSGTTAEQIDKQINKLILEAQARAQAILKEHKDDLERLRDEVLAKKTLDGDRVQEIIREFKGRPKAGRKGKAPGEAK